MSSSRPSCLVCHATCKTAEKLKKHASGHVSIVPVYQCKVSDCKEYFNKKPKFLMHRLTEHGESGGRGVGYHYRKTYVCVLCGCMFFKKVTCVQHILQHENMAHECAKCKWTFTSQYRLKVHKALWHMQRKKPKKPKVEIKTWYETHEEQKKRGTGETYSSNQKRYVCPSNTCRLYIGSYEELLAHAAKEHKIMEPRSCIHCTRNFNNKEALQRHYDNHDQMRYKCPVSICFCVFQTDRELSNHHAAYHQGRDNVAFRKMPTKTLTKGSKTSKQSKKTGLETERKCPMCGRVFQSDTQLMDHVTSHANMEYRCLQPSCGWEFEIFSSMCSHYGSRHDMKIAKSCARLFKMEKNGTVTDGQCKLYRCQYNNCGYNVSGSFAQYDEVLAHHIAVHDEVYEECGFCGRKLLEADLEIHVSSHEKMKYKCLEQSCGWEFARFGTLFVHYFTCHKITISKEEEQKFVIGAATEKDIEETEEDANGYICPLCNRQFAAKTKLLSHIDNHNNMAYRCDKCKWEFVEFGFLLRHHNDVHKNVLHLTRNDEQWHRLKRFDAEREPRATRRSARNQGMHDNDTTRVHQYKYPCPVVPCKTGCDSFSELEKHLKFIHHSLRGSCPVCSRFFPEALKYRVHVERHISGSTWHRCLYCGCTYDGIKSLQSHFKQHHQWVDTLDESHYDIVPDAVFEDEDSTSAYEDSDLEIISVEESDESKNKQIPAIKKETHSDQTVGNKSEITPELPHNHRAWKDLLETISRVQNGQKSPNKANNSLMSEKPQLSNQKAERAMTKEQNSSSVQSICRVKRQADDLDLQSVSKRRNTNIQCAFCHETFDILDGMESHKCYRDIYTASTETNQKPKETSSNTKKKQKNTYPMVNSIATATQAYQNKENQKNHFDSLEDKKPIVNIDNGRGDIDRKQTLTSGHQTFQSQSQQGAHDALSTHTTTAVNTKSNSPHKANIVCDENMSLITRAALGLGDLDDLPDIVDAPNNLDIGSSSGLAVRSVDSGISVSDFDPSLSNFDWSEVERVLSANPSIDGFPSAAVINSNNSAGTGTTEGKLDRCANDFLQDLFEKVIDSTCNDKALDAATTDQNGKATPNVTVGINSSEFVNETSVPFAPQVPINDMISNVLSKSSPKKDNLHNASDVGVILNQRSAKHPELKASQLSIRDNQKCHGNQSSGNNNNTIQFKSTPVNVHLQHAGNNSAQLLIAQQNTPSQPVVDEEPILIEDLDDDDEPESVIVID